MLLSMVLHAQRYVQSVQSVQSVRMPSRTRALLKCIRTGSIVETFTSP